jgi:SAM-dependent methyltransferase
LVFELPDSGWESFARREPYFAVLTSPEFLRANLTAETERAFFAGGEEYVAWMRRVIDERLVPEFAPLSTLEYGCGVGRLALPFAGRPGRVTAVDRSPAMLDAARHEAERRGVRHIEFLTPRELFTPAVDPGGRRPAFDLVNCYGVLQRLRPADGVALLQQLVALIAPGGVGVFQVPFRSTTSRLVELSRWMRQSVPGVNAVANLMRGKPPGDPFMASHTYDLNDVFRSLYSASAGAMHVVFERQEGFAAAIVFVQVPSGRSRRALTVSGDAGPAAIDVRKMIATTSIDDLNRTAEAYFASLTDWNHHLAKPFNNPDETPTLLLDVAMLLQGLRLTAGTRVLEFGAGTGWLSRFLTQLGCRVTLLDVSPTALRIARELYERHPVIGERPTPVFLSFDGRRIDLPDASVDRIVSFHAFHHATNPDAMLEEFSRVLAPGGIAAFAEPGPRHAERPQSQFEMRTYGVVENNVDVHAIWRKARACGFTDLKLVVSHAPPFHVSLEEYEDLLAAGPTLDRWDASTRGVLRHVRNFFLYKGTPAPTDSRSTVGLRCAIHAELTSPPGSQPLVVDATVKNTGEALWLAPGIEVGAVELGAHLYDEAGTLLAFDFRWEHLVEPLRDIQPGEVVTCRMTLPRLAPGRYVVEVDCVSSRVAWFAQLGAQPVRIPVEVTL